SSPRVRLTTHFELADALAIAHDRHEYPRLLARAALPRDNGPARGAERGVEVEVVMEIAHEARAGLGIVPHLEHAPRDEALEPRRITPPAIGRREHAKEHADDQRGEDDRRAEPQEDALLKARVDAPRVAAAVRPV